MPSKRVFREPKNAKEEKDYMDSCVSRATRYATKWAYKIFGDWQSSRRNTEANLEERGFRVEVESIQSLETSIVEMIAESLDFRLTKFFAVCKENGERYPPSSLYSICCGLQCYLEKSNGREAIKFLNKDEARLSTFRRALDAELRECCADGVANETKKEYEEAITAEEEKILWEKNLLGCHSARSLLHTIYSYNGKLFGIHAKEHRDLRCNNFRVESNGVIFGETVSKTYHGGPKDLMRAPRVVKHVCCDDFNFEYFPCLVNCYTTYLENIKS